jgi:hypothetical protein
MVWAATERLDARVFGCDYSDVALLGKAVSRRHWLPVGLAIHALNGAAFGVAFDIARRRVPVRPANLAIGMALAENAARGEPGLPPLAKNGPAFAQACWRHTLFGWVLGKLA